MSGVNMNPNTGLQMGPGGASPHDKLIKPGQVHNLQCLTPDQKITWFDGVSKIWKKLEEFPADHPEHRSAFRKLTEVSNTLRIQMQKWRTENPPAGHPASTRLAQPNGTGGPAFRPAAHAAAGEIFSETVKNQARSLSLIAPPQIAALSPADRMAWENSEKRKYASMAQRYEVNSKLLHDLNNLVAVRQSQGKAFAADETVTIKSRINQFQQAIQESRDALAIFRAQHERYRQEAEREADSHFRGIGVTAGGELHPPPGLPADQGSTNSAHHAGDDAGGVVEPAGPSGSIATGAPGDTGAMGAGGGELDGARAAAAGGPERSSSALSPSGSNQPGPTPTSHAPPSRPDSGSGPGSGFATAELQVSQGSVSTNVNAATTAYSQQQQQQQPQHHSPPATSNPAASASQGPIALSHKDAMAKAAHSYSSQSSVPPHTVSTSTHAHPTMNSREPQSSNAKWPTSKNLNVSPLTPVAMGPARPTLSGGPSTGATGPMGQPAIQKHPGYVLEGQGERVLSKNKLEELVRQVTGGVDGEGAEALDPDVEEVRALSSFCVFLTVTTSIRLTVW